MHSHALSRRSFLRRAGLAGTGLVLGTALPAPLLAAVPDPIADGEPVTETRVLMGSFVGITVAQASAAHAEDGLNRVFEAAPGLAFPFDRHDPSSPLSALNTQGRLNDAPPELSALLSRSLRYGSLTSGAFDMTVAPVLDLFRDRRNPTGALRVSAAELRDALALVDARGVHIDGPRLELRRNGMRVTLDGIAKGHVADGLSRRLLELGLNNHLINAGGDIVAKGEKAPGVPWTVAVEDPSKRAAYPCLLRLRDKAVATSGSYEVFYDASREHHHLINPATGGSPAWAASVTVTAADALEADALATALSILPPQDALRLVSALPGRECCIFDRRGRRFASRGWA